MSENQENKKPNEEIKGEAKGQEMEIKPIEGGKMMNIDEIAATNPDGFAVKMLPPGRNLIIEYLNSRPMVQVEVFFNNMFDIEDQDPFFTIPWIKRLFDYLRNVCPRGEARGIVVGLSQNLVVFTREPKKPEGKTEEDKPSMKVVEESKPEESKEQPKESKE